MRNFTLRKGFLGSKCGTRSSFKGFVMLVVMMLMMASSAMAEVIDGIRYMLDPVKKTATLLPKKEGKYSGDIIIPEKIKGNDGVEYVVTSLSESCFKDCDNLTSITIPSSVTSLGGGCFYACRGLTSITIPSSVTSLGNYCFYACRGLTSITIPSSVTSLGEGCFKDCDNLTSITIPSSVTSLGEWCFRHCSGLTSITIPSSVTSLGGGCFSDCRGLTSITIPSSSVTSLSAGCFEYCSGLTSITIPSSVTSLGNYCFSGCRGLTSITIPSSVTSLSAGCFEYCSGLTSITIPSSVTSLGAYCFGYCSGLTSITIPSSVTSLGVGCFSGCRGLTSITIPSSVTSLGTSCFSGCSVLTSITIPSSVTSLGEWCFRHCSGLETVYFKGKEPENTSQSEIPTTTIIKVPKEYLQDYKDAFGYNYKYIFAWNPDETGDDNKPVTQCSTPSISYESGKLMFACETTGAKYHYTITDTDITSDALSENGEVSLSAAYNISVYATADGYTASDKAEATLYWINANLENGTNINQVRTRGIVASAHDGIITLSGLDDGEVVKFFAADGKYLGSTVAANGAASYAVSESLVIAKVGKDSIKIAMK